MRSLSWLRMSLLVVAVVTVAGCAAMSKRECQLGDWHTAGFDDGAMGIPVTRLADYAKACGKYSISPDLATYRTGYDLGLETYCRDSNGFAVGSRGAAYGGVCPANLEVQFLQGFRVGHQLFELQAVVNGIEGQIGERREMLQESTERLAATQAAIISDSTSADQRIILLAKAGELWQQQRSLEAEIVQLQRNLAVSQQDLSRFQGSLAYNR
jgi:hypothetical protein